MRFLDAYAAERVAVPKSKNCRERRAQKSPLGAGYRIGGGRYWSAAAPCGYANHIFRPIKETPPRERVPSGSKLTVCRAIDQGRGTARFLNNILRAIDWREVA